MGEMVKKYLNKFSIIGILFSIIYTYFYLLNDSILFKDVLNRIDFFSYFNIVSYLSNPFLLIKDIGDLFTALIQRILLNKGLIVNSFYVFSITEIIIDNLKNKSKNIQILSRLYFYSILLIKPFAISFWDHHNFFLFFGLASKLNFNQGILKRYLKYVFFLSLEPLLLPYFIVVKTRTLLDSITLSAAFICGLIYSYTSSNYNSISEPSTILTLIVSILIFINILIMILRKNKSLFSSYFFMLLFFSFLLFNSSIYGQNITNRFILNYSPIFPFILFGREYIYDKYRINS